MSADFSKYQVSAISDLDKSSNMSSRDMILLSQDKGNGFSSKSITYKDFLGQINKDQEQGFKDKYIEKKEVESKYATKKSLTGYNNSTDDKNYALLFDENQKKYYVNVPWVQGTGEAYATKVGISSDVKGSDYDAVKVATISVDGNPSNIYIKNVNSQISSGIVDGTYDFDENSTLMFFSGDDYSQMKSISYNNLLQKVYEKITQLQENDHMNDNTLYNTNVITLDNSKFYASETVDFASVWGGDTKTHQEYEKKISQKCLVRLNLNYRFNEYLNNKWVEIVNVTSDGHERLIERITGPQNGNNGTVQDITRFFNCEAESIIKLNFFKGTGRFDAEFPSMTATFYYQSDNELKSWSTEKRRLEPYRFASGGWRAENDGQLLINGYPWYVTYHAPTALYWTHVNNVYYWTDENQKRILQPLTVLPKLEYMVDGNKYYESGCPSPQGYSYIYNPANYNNLGDFGSQFCLIYNKNKSSADGKILTQDYYNDWFNKNKDKYASSFCDTYLSDDITLPEKCGSDIIDTLMQKPESYVGAYIVEEDPSSYLGYKLVSDQNGNIARVDMTNGMFVEFPIVNVKKGNVYHVMFTRAADSNASVRANVFNFNYVYND